MSEHARNLDSWNDSQDDTTYCPEGDCDTCGRVDLEVFEEYDGTYICRECDLKEARDDRDYNEAILSL